MEGKLLDSLSDNAPRGLILSCGGGLPVASGNMDKLKGLGLTIYLTASVNTLASRLQNGKSDYRPMIGRFESENDLKNRLADLLSGRRAIYERAHLTINTEDKSVTEVAATIQSILTKTTL
jgi:shikimate kinase